MKKMSGNSKSSAEDIINACENKPNPEKWMEVKKCFQDLQGELYDLMQKYPEKAEKRKVPDNLKTKPEAMMTENVNTVIGYLENVQKYNPKTAGEKEAAKREVLDMADFIYQLKQNDKEQGKGGNVSCIHVRPGGASSPGTGGQQKDIDEMVSYSKKPKNVYNSGLSNTCTPNQKSQPKDKSFAKTLPASSNPTTVDNQPKNEKQSPGNAGAKGGKEKEEDKKNKKSADENKDEELQKKIRELESKVKQMENAEKILNEKANVAENRCNILEDEKGNLNKTIEELQTRSKILDEETTKLQSRNIDYEKQLQELHQKYIVKEAQCGDLRLRLNNSESRNADVESENKYLKEQVDELTMRLSSFASKQLSEGNPNVADLSDQNRPTKIGEKFGSLYDDEWSEAFDAITTPEKSEDDAIKYLINIIQESYNFCTKTAHEQLEKLTEKMKTLMIKFEYKDKEGQTHEINSSLDDKPNIDSARAKYAKDYRKAAACESLLGVKQMFKERVLKEELDKFSGETKDSVIAYVDKCTELIWFMVVQDPPMVIEIPEPGKKFNANAFKPYKTKGKLVKLAVWPAVKLFENGGLISKGYALPE